MIAEVDENSFLKHCLDRTQIDTNYRIVISASDCNCLRCSEDEKKQFEYFTMFLVADNHNFDQPILSTCGYRKIFTDKFLEYRQMLKFVSLLIDKEKYPKLEYYGKSGRTNSFQINCGTDILIAKEYLLKILKMLYRHGIDKNYKTINDAVTFFDSIQSNNE